MAQVTIQILGDTIESDASIYNPSTLVGITVGMVISSPYIVPIEIEPGVPGTGPITVGGFYAPANQIFVNNGNVIATTTQEPITLTGEGVDYGASIVWPASLPQTMNQEGYSYSLGDVTLRSEVDVGLAKVRARTTRAVDRVAFTQNVTVDQVQTIRGFYRTDTNAGTQKFLFPDPLSPNVPLICRFSKAPTFSPLGGLLFQATFELEVLP